MAPATRQRAYSAWVVVCVLWGTTYLAIRIALETIPPLFLAGWRYVLAGAILLTVLRVRRERLPSRSTWPHLAWLGFLLLGLGNGGVVWAEQTVPSGLTALLVATTPFWMVAIDALMPGGDSLSARRGLGLLAGFLGVLLLVWPDLHLRDGRGYLEGLAAAQIASVGWAVGSNYSRRRGASENVVATAALQMLFGGMFLVAAGVIHQEWRGFGLTARTLGAWIYLVAFGGVVGFSAYAYALKHLPLATVSLYAYVNPVIAVMLGTLVLDEPFSARIGVAGAIVLAGMWVVRTAPSAIRRGAPMD
jgi:drug/metabolite transporter (DMT)-like permease